MFFFSYQASARLLKSLEAEPGSPSGPSIPVTTTTRVSLFRSIFSFLSFNKAPRARSRQNTSEGLLSPHSPNLSRIPPHYPPPPSPRMPPAPLAPPRSPGILHSPNTQEIEVQVPTSTNVRLHAPPARRRSSQALRPSGNSLGLGIRRPINSRQDDDTLT